jgi:hypothetical protein
MNNISDIFPGYTYKQVGIFDYEWYKDGNKLGKRKSKEMTMKFNKLMMDSLKAING